MRRLEVLTIIILCTITISLVISPADATNNQGLYWGVSDGARFDYSYTETSSTNVSSTVTTSELKFQYYVIISGLPNIPDDYNLYIALYPDTINYYYANGTEFEHIMFLTLFTVLPVGNWTVFSSSIESEGVPGYNYTIIDTYYEWGLEMTRNSSYIEGSTGVTLLKSDGAMNRFWLNQRLIFGDQESSSIEVHRLVDTSPIAVVGLAVGSILVAIISFEFYSRRKRSRIPEIERGMPVEMHFHIG